MALEEEMNNRFDQEDTRLMIVMWDQYGLESVIDVTQEQKNRLFDMITGKDQTFEQWLNQTVHYCIMRATVNSQRNYEIYSVKVDTHMDGSYMTKLFEENPQMIVNLIRKRGHKLYSASAGYRQPVIF
jgi:hypothetical protein